MFFSILSALKEEIAAQAKEDVPSASAQAQSAQAAQPNINRGSSKFRLSDALADVHGAVDEDARAEQKRREQQAEYDRTSREAEANAERERRQAEANRRIASEEERRRSLSHAKHLKQVIADYESALIRGDHVELPEELKASAPAASPFVAPAEPQVIMTPPPKPDLVKPIALGTVAAMVLTGALYVFVFTPQVDELTKQNSLLTSERDNAREARTVAQNELNDLQGRKSDVDQKLKNAREALKQAQAQIAELGSARPAKATRRGKRSGRKRKRKIKIKLGGN